MTFRGLLHGSAGLAALAGTEWALYKTGGGILAGPRLDDPRVWPAWVLARPPDIALLALVRLAALVLGAYLLCVFGAGLAVRLLRLRPAIGGVDRLTPAALRHFLDRVTGVAAAGAVAVAGMTVTAGPVAADPAPGRSAAGAAAHGPPATTYGPPLTLRGLAGPQPDTSPTTTTTIRPLPVVSPPATLPPERRRITPPDLREVPSEAPDEVVDDVVEPPPPPTPDATADDPADARGHEHPPTEPGDVEGLPRTGETAPDPQRYRATPDSATSSAPPNDLAGSDAGRSDHDTGGSGPTDEVATDPGAEPDGADPGPRSSAGVAAPASPVAADARWEVEAGDHFWSIAERTLADAWSRQPTVSEIDPYWRDLIERNRTRLADPGNADLLFPGQVLELPPVPLRPAA